VSGRDSAKAASMRGRVFRFGEAFRARIGMTGLARTPVLPEATPVGALSAQLRHPRTRPAMCAKRRNQSHWSGFLTPARASPNREYFSRIRLRTGVVQRERRNRDNAEGQETRGRLRAAAPIVSPLGRTKPPSPAWPVERQLNEHGDKIGHLVRFFFC
jgi:hypothetical protein